MLICFFFGIEFVNIFVVNVVDGIVFIGVYVEYELKLGVFVGGFVGCVRIGKVCFGVKEFD